MSQKQAYWGCLMFVIGMLVGVHMGFIQELALDRQILLVLGIVIVVRGSYAISVFRGMRDDGDL